MTYAEITAAASQHIEKPGFAKTDGLFRAGMEEGFVDGSTWAQSQLDAEIARLRLAIKAAIADLENEAKTAALARLKNALR